MVGLLVSLTSISKADEFIKMPMQDLIVTDMDYIYEIKTTKFDKVILDCQSFITGMNFSNAGVVKSNVYLNMFECEEMVTFLLESKENSEPVCLGLDADNNQLLITRETDECK